MNCAKDIFFRLLYVLNVIIFLLICHFLSSSREMMVVVGHNGKKGVELSHARIGVFLINDV